MQQMLKRAAALAHGLAASHRRLASPYLAAFRLAKCLPDAGWKKFVLNSLNAVEWPPLTLPPARVELLRGVAVSIVPHAHEFDFASHLYRRLDYEPELATWIAGRSYDDVLEIGANVGVYTLFFSKLWPEAKIYSFEPSRTAYLRLQTNLALNHCSNVVTFNCAVAPTTGVIDFYEPFDHLTNGSLNRQFAAQFSNVVAHTKVLSMGGSQIASLFSGGRRLLLKIDVEGAEPVVINAISEIIRARRPDIVLEVLPEVVEELNRVDLFSDYQRFQLSGQALAKVDSFTAGSIRDFVLLPR